MPTSHEGWMPPLTSQVVPVAGGGGWGRHKWARAAAFLPGLVGLDQMDLPWSDPARFFLGSQLLSHSLCQGK